jgi:hypothetical protein
MHDKTSTRWQRRFATGDRTLHLSTHCSAHVPDSIIRSQDALEGMLPSLAGVVRILGCIVCELDARIHDARLAGTLLVPDACQFASYPVEGAYTVHRDNFLHPSTKARFNDRVLTLIFYLNDEWEAADGGELRVHPHVPHESDETFLPTFKGGREHGGEAGAYTDYVPAAGTVVLFRSELLHEVLANTHRQGRRRAALTMWVCNVLKSTAKTAASSAQPLARQ